MRPGNIPKEFNPGISQPNYLVRSGLLMAFEALVPKLNGKLMDFGCGSKPYKSLFNVTEYIGVDYDSEGHSHTNEEIDVFYDGKTIPFEDDRFDAIFSSEVFEHIFNLEEILKELNRVLKVNGKILISCPFAICEHEVPVDFARYSSYGLTDLLKRNGFEVLEFHKTGTAVTTVHQLWLTYIHQHISPIVKNIPVVRSAFRTITYTLVNLCAQFLDSILPRRDDLYLNNVVLAKKTGNIV
jgi:SAM-dependent methyltransferase